MPKPMIDANALTGIKVALDELRGRWEYWDAAIASGLGTIDTSRAEARRYEVWTCYDRIRKLAKLPEWNPVPATPRKA